MKHCDLSGKPPPSEGYRQVSITRYNLHVHFSSSVLLPTPARYYWHSEDLDPGHGVTFELIMLMFIDILHKATVHIELYVGSTTVMP